MNIEQEIKGLVEMIDDACNDAFEEWSMNFTERQFGDFVGCLLYTSPSPRDRTRSRMPSSA